MRTPTLLSRPRTLGLGLLVTLLTGCIGSRVIYPVEPTPEELAVFQAAGPQAPDFDLGEMTALLVGRGAYAVGTGDLIEFQLPKEVTGEVSAGEEFVIVKGRVDGEGAVRLPLVGEVNVAGKDLATIERQLVGLYHPDYLRDEPNVVATVAEHQTVGVAVVGAVTNPGIHRLRSDRMSLVGAIMEAGGISGDRGAALISVLNATTEEGTQSVHFPVRGSNIPQSDFPLLGGETIVVEPTVDKQFTVIGLVRRPGAFGYPPGRKYNLMQVLAVAGGTDAQAAPRYATVYRKKPTGEVIGATFRIDGTALSHASNILVKPGDVVAVEHTQGSWLRQFFSQVFGFRASFSASSAGQI